MAVTFNEVPIEDLCKKVTSGATPLRSRADFYDGGTIDWYKTGELKDWYLGPADERITEKALKETSIKLFPANTVLMAMYGDGKTITSMGMLRAPAGTNQACSAMLVDEEKCDPRYFFYALKGRRDLLLKVASGGAQRNLSGKLIKEFLLPVPPLPIQQRIAGILSAYDELIENSQRRIKILESMARTFYSEWFVHFRFPGHENHPRVASPLGEIPQGWTVKTLRDVTTKIGSGATPRGGKDAYKSEGINLIRSLNIYDYHFEFSNLAFIDENQASKLDNVIVEEDDVLLNITGASVARCALVPNYLLPARVNQHVAIVRADPAKVSPFYILDTINSDQRKHQLLTLAQGGATREALTKDTISDFEIALPPSPLMEGYNAVAGSIHRQREVLLRQVQNLRCTRELMLPRLMSGQINVEVN